MDRIGIGTKCVSLLIVATNVIFLLLGVLLIVIGAVMLTVFQDFEKFIESHHFSPASLVIAIGVIILIISFFGCFGAIKYSTCLIRMHALLLSLILIVELAAVIAAFVSRCNIYDSVQDSMRTIMNEYKKELSSRDAWDFTQQKLHCCGIHNPYDWASQKLLDGAVIEMNDHLFTVPYSCCRYPDKCGLVYKKGCLDTLSDGVAHYSFMIGIAALVVALVQVIGIMFSCTLAKAVRRSKTMQEVERTQNQRIQNMQHACNVRDAASA